MVKADGSSTYEANAAFAQQIRTYPRNTANQQGTGNDAWRYLSAPNNFNLPN